MSSTVQDKTPTPKGTKPRASTTGRASLKLHSIPAWLSGKDFAGEFETGATKHSFVFVPQRGELVDKKLQLVGSLSISGPGARAHKVPNFRMTLLANQGGIGQAPTRHHHHDLHGVAGIGQQAKADRIASSGSGGQSAGLPLTDSTDSRSFCGVMYFLMAPIDARAMGISADMTKVQLNLRFAPTIDQERDFQDIYSELVAAVLGKDFDEESARAVLEDLNKALG